MCTVFFYYYYFIGILTLRAEEFTDGAGSSPPPRPQADLPGNVNIEDATLLVPQSSVGLLIVPHHIHICRLNTLILAAYRTLQIKNGRTTLMKWAVILPSFLRSNALVH